MYYLLFSWLDHSSWWHWSKKSAIGPINFYNRDDPYYEFTNFYSAPIKVDKKTWPTSEHYFQAQKFVGTPYEEQIRHLPWPRQVIEFTRDPKVSPWRRSDWKSIKKDVMYKALLAKFTQHDYLRKLLLGTGERKLIDHNPYDSYRGDGGDGMGQNHLGELLMQLRRELQSGWNSKKGATHIHQEVTSEHFQHSSPWEQSDNTPRSSENGNWNCQASHTGLLRQPLHPTDPAYQPSNSGSNIVSANPPHQQGSAMHVAGSVPSYQSITSSTSQEENRDFSEVGMSYKQVSHCCRHRRELGVCVCVCVCGVGGGLLFSAVILDYLLAGCLFTSIVQAPSPLPPVLHNIVRENRCESWNHTVCLVLSCTIFLSAAVPPDQQCKLKGCTWPRYIQTVSHRIFYSLYNAHLHSKILRFESELEPI